MFKAKALVILTVCTIVNSIFFLFAWYFLGCSLENDLRSSKLMSGCYIQDWRSATTKVLQHSKNIANWQEISSCGNGMHVIRGFQHVSTQIRVFTAAGPWRVPLFNVGGF